MLLIVGTVRMPADNLPAALPAMKRMVESSRAEEGCEEYSYAADLLDPGLIHVTERWRDQEALDRHFGSAHLTEWRRSWPSLGIRDRNLRVYEVSAPRQT